MAAADFEALSRRFRYEPETGLLIRLTSRGKYQAGEPAGRKDDKGYLVISHAGRPIGVHRVAVLLMTGEWPKDEVDHRNRVRDDNRWDNLRDVDRQTNAQNVAGHRDSKHLPGVSPNGKGFMAKLLVRGKQTYLGTFSTQDDAHAAYVAAKRHHHAGCTL